MASLLHFTPWNAPINWRQRILQIAFLGLLAMVVIGLNPLSDRIKTTPATGDGDTSRQVVYIGVVLLTILGTINLPLRRAMPIPLPILIGIAWCLLSLTWAIEPGVGLRRLILTAMIIWTIFRCMEEIGYEAAMWSMRIILLATLVLNYVAIAVTPAAIHHATELAESNIVGSWRGVLAHKNWAGPICAFTIIAFLFDAKRWNLTFRAVVIAATAYFLYKTQSKTSMGILAVSLACGWLYVRYNPAYRALLVPGAIIVGCLIIVYIDVKWGAIVAMLDDPQAFTGRAQIWEMLLRYAADYPITGAGYGSFWNIGQNGPAYEYGRGWLKTLGNGHSGYLDLLTQIGIPGLFIILIATIIWPVVQLLGSVSVPRQKGALVLALIIFCAGHNLTETGVFDRDMITQVFLMASIALTQVLTRPINFRGSRRRSLAGDVRDHTSGSELAMER